MLSSAAVCEMSADPLLEVLKEGELYVSTHERAAKALASGLFRLAQARHSVRGGSLSVENCRLDMEPTATLHADELVTALSAEAIDPILFVAALPPPQLRAAQAEFSAALKELAALASVARRVLSKSRSALEE